MSCKLRKNSKSGEILPNLVTLIADHFSCKKRRQSRCGKLLSFVNNERASARKPILIRKD